MLIALELPRFFYHYQQTQSWRTRNSLTTVREALILDCDFSVL